MSGAPGEGHWRCLVAGETSAAPLCDDRVWQHNDCGWTAPSVPGGGTGQRPDTALLRADAEWLRDQRFGVVNFTKADRLEEAADWIDVQPPASPVPPTRPSFQWNGRNVTNETDKPMTRTPDRIAILTGSAFVAAIVLANWLTSRYGFVPVGLGLSATAGTYAAGATFTLRDDVQDRAGLRWVLAVIAVGCAVSYLVATPALAVASFVAFMLAELADLAVYTPLKRSGRWNAAVWISGLVGAAADSVLFLWLAFGFETVTRLAVAGQVLGKMWAVGAVWLIVRWLRR